MDELCTVTYLRFLSYFLFMRFQSSFGVFSFVGIGQSSLGIYSWKVLEQNVLNNLWLEIEPE